ncbi:MAG: AMP-binding protein [Candidatus Dormibacteraeota bacterium]|nr:AMP-binding protein [Candidatus Dormibacteraeota bacterium]
MHSYDRPGQTAQLLEARARLLTDHAAYVDASTGEALSWTSLRSLTERWRSLAVDFRMPARSRIGLVIADPLAFAGSYIACLAAGLTTVPLDPRVPAAEVLAAAARLRVDVVATDRGDLMDSVTPQPLWHAGVGDIRGMRGAAADRWPSDGAALRPAALLESSGTSGMPKVVPLEEAQLLAAAARIARHHHIRLGDRGYTPLPLFHVNAQVVGLLSTLVSGSTLVVDNRFHASDYWARVAEWRPTWLNTVPAMLATLAELAPPPETLARRVRFARSAAAPLRADVESRFERHAGIGVLQTYGMTEGASQLTANPLDELMRRPGSVGLPVGVEVAVLDASGRTLDAGTAGIVHVRGEGVISSYLVAGDAARERTRPARDAHGWLSTRDVGWFDDDGFLHLLGRADDVINRGGEKLYPIEIERVLIANPNVAGAIVVGTPDDRLGEVPVAYVVTRHNEDPAHEGDFARACAAELPAHKRPVRIRRVRALPTGPTGKVLRNIRMLEEAAA